MSANLNNLFEEIEDDGKVFVDTKKRKRVDLRSPTEAEDQLLADITAPDRDGIGASIPIKGRWIHAWLEGGGEDYINNIHNNWLFFTKYVELRTDQFINTSRFTIKQGHYEDTYRYLLVLEDLGLIERHRKEEVDASEYDHFVPENMRQRTYVRIVKSMEEEPELWKRPHAHAYPDGKARDTEEDDVPEEPVEPEEPQEEPSSEQDDTPLPIDDFKEDEEVDSDEMPETVQDNIDEGFRAIHQYPELDELEDRIDDWFRGAVESAFEDSTIVVDEIDVTDFQLDRIAVFGVWAEGLARQGDKLDLYVTVDGTDAELQPSWVLDGMRANLGEFLSNDPRVDDEWFESVTVQSAYSNVFRNNLEDLVLQAQESNFYYDLQERKYSQL